MGFGFPPARRRRVRELSIHFEAGVDGPVTRMESPRGVSRAPFRPPAPGTSSPESYGSALFEALFTKDVRELYALTLGSLRSRDILRLCFHQDVLGTEPTAGLDSLPWELLRDAAGNHLALDPHRSIVRRPGQLIAPFKAPEVPLPLEVLILVADPHGDLSSAEADLIEQSFRNSPSIHVTCLKKATMERLGEELQKVDRPVHVLHFIGHGDVDSQGVGRVFFEDALGQPHAVTGETLRHLLGGHPELRLIVLNACRTAEAAPALGVATSLLAAGFPTVIAMRDEISDETAVAFSRGLYSRLAAGDLLDVAMREGRRAIFSKAKDSLEWTTPVLFLRGGDGYLFRVGGRNWPQRTVVLELARGLAATSKLHTPPGIETAARALQIAANELETETRPKGQGLAVTLPTAAADRLLATEQEPDPAIDTLRSKFSIRAIYRPDPAWITFALGILGNLVAAIIERDLWSASVTPGRIATLVVLTGILLYWRSFTRLRRRFGRQGLIAALAAAFIITATYAFSAFAFPPECHLAKVELNAPAGAPHTLKLDGNGVTDLTNVNLEGLQDLTGRAVLSRRNCPCGWTLTGAVGEQLQPLGTAGANFKIYDPARYSRIYLELNEGERTHLFTLRIHP